MLYSIATESAVLATCPTLAEAVRLAPVVTTIIETATGRVVSFTYEEVV